MIFCPSLAHLKGYYHILAHKVEGNGLHILDHLTYRIHGGPEPSTRHPGRQMLEEGEGVDCKESRKDSFRSRPVRVLGKGDKRVIFRCNIVPVHDGHDNSTGQSAQMRRCCQVYPYTW